jgi:predicted small lipoprotein YifL
MAYSVSALTTLNLYMTRIKRRVKTQLFLVAMVAMVLFLAACGQRGPLYLPKPEPAPATTQETQANETEPNEIEVNEIEAIETEDDETGDDLE